MSSAAALSPAARQSAIDAMASTTGSGSAVSGRPLDVLVVGGGIVGAGTALDAVTRGLSVGLIEQRDFASGTSSRSSKLIHGGLRYLEMLDFSLVREALEERGLLLTRLAPHLVKPVSFLYPLRHRGWERPYVGAGLAVYDVMAMAGKYEMGLPRHRHLFRRQVRRIAPDLRDDAFVGAVEYHDAQVDDARLVVTVARTAALHGALCATRTRATGFLREGERVTGVRVTDLESGRDLEVRARVVVNAAGVWTDEIQDMVGRGALHVQASKGIHLVVPRDRIRSDSGIILRTPTSVLFVIPWGAHWIIGTTDTGWNLDKAHPAASRTDIDYLLGQVNKVLREPLGHADVEGVYAGLRPLLFGESEPTSRISREHTVVTPVPGMVIIAGGKLTTYRLMGKDAVDAAVQAPGHPLGEGVPGSITDRVRLVGSDGYETRSNQRAALARTSGLRLARVDHLLNRYGGLIDEVLVSISQRPELARPLEGAEDYLAAEVAYAVTHEGARHLDDVLTRRTRISIETFDRGVAAAAPTAALMAAELGWDEQRRVEEVDHYLRRVEAERQSQLELTDHEADEERIKVTDIV